MPATPRTAEAFAPAKINLTLHVTGPRADGYHLLDSLVVFADVGDWVRVTPADAMSLAVTGPRGAGVPADAGNLVWRAAEWFGPQPVAISLEKHLPAAAGIGGGSSDAAAVLRAMAAAFGRDLPKLAACAELGADVPVCLLARPTRMRGVGAHLAPLPGLPPLHLVLVNPGVSVSTPEVFAHLAEKTNRPMPEDLPDWPDAAAFARWLATQRNDLELPARALAPAIGVVLTRLSQSGGCLLARMSGSGATCFGLYATRVEAGAAAADICRVAAGLVGQIRIQLGTRRLSGSNIFRKMLKGIFENSWVQVERSGDRSAGTARSQRSAGKAFRNAFHR